METTIGRLAVALMVSIGLLTAVLLRLATDDGVKQSKDADGEWAFWTRSPSFGLLIGRGDFRRDFNEIQTSNSLENARKVILPLKNGV